MKKMLFMVGVLALLAVNIYCGGGGDSSDSSNTTAVTINLGETRSISSDRKGILTETATLPSSIASIRFTISAPDMVTIQRTVSTAGKTAISEAFEITNGADRHFLVEALDAAGNVLYRGETYVNLNGVLVTISIVLVSTDPIAPIFSGLSSITSITGTSLTLSWSSAADNVSPQDKIQYLIYRATTSGGQNFASPTYTTTAGATTYNVTGLTRGVTYYFVVRAMDERGNIDTNTVERFTTTQFVDLSISNVSTSPTLSFEVNNSGNIAANNVVVFALYSDLCGQTCQSSTVTVPANSSVSVSISTMTVSSYNIIADPANTIVESNETNNEACLGALCGQTPTTCP